MPADAYVKFGESDGKGPNGTPLPAIEGDSTDTWHYWWCELRSCNFDLEAADWKTEEEEEGQSDPNATAKFRKVTLKKRVDWASTQLFRECCDQALALSKPEAEQRDGWIDTVTVEVCRQTGDMVKLGDEMVEEKLPFVTVMYHGVRVTHYSIEMSGPEPSESITFEFQSLEFRYERTDPYTGRRLKDGGVVSTGDLANSAAGAAGAVTAGAGVSVAASAGAAVVAIPGGGGGSTATATPAGAPPAAAPPPVDVSISANFSGFGSITGPGTFN